MISQKARATFLALVSSCAFAIPAAQAGLFDVTLSADLLANDFVINNSDGAVFGVAPSDTSFSVKLRVDSSSGVDSASAGDSTVVAGNTYTFAHDVWGYGVSVLSATFGTKTWTDADVLTLNFGDGIDSSQLFLDAELGTGTPSLASFHLQNDGFAFFGKRPCGGANCWILQGLEIRDFNGGNIDRNLNDYVFANTYEISVSAVPVPAAIWLFGTALVGFIGMSRQRKIA